MPVARNIPAAIPTARPVFSAFVSEERHEPPDIDAMSISSTSGADRHAMGVPKPTAAARRTVSTVIRYRQGAHKDVGKALGLLRTSSRCCSSHVWGCREGVEPDRSRNEPQSRRPAPRLTLEFGARIDRRAAAPQPAPGLCDPATACELVPIEPAAMAGRQVIEWTRTTYDAAFMKWMPRPGSSLA